MKLRDSYMIHRREAELLRFAFSCVNVSIVCTICRKRYWIAHQYVVHDIRSLLQWHYQVPLHCGATDVNHITCVNLPDEPRKFHLFCNRINTNPRVGLFLQNTIGDIDTTRTSDKNEERVLPLPLLAASNFLSICTPSTSARTSKLQKVLTSLNKLGAP